MRTGCCGYLETNNGVRCNKWDNSRPGTDKKTETLRERFLRERMWDYPVQKVPVGT